MLNSKRKSSSCKARIENIPEVSVPVEHSKTANVLILGAPCTGKSAILSCLVGNRFVAEKVPSTSEELSILGEDGNCFHLHFQTLRCAESQGCWSSDFKRDVIKANVFLLIYAVNDRESFNRALEYREKLGTLRGDIDSRVLLVGNKIDLVRARVISPAEAELRALHWNTDVVEVSAKGPHNFGELKLNIYRMADVPLRLYSSKRRSSLQQLKSALMISC